MTTTRVPAGAAGSTEPDGATRGEVAGADEVVDAIARAVAVVKGPDVAGAVVPGTVLADLHLDSLDVLEVLMHLESEYALDLPGLELVKGLQSHSSTVGDLADAFVAYTRRS